jgi:predicted RNA-binding protein with PUA-like domain
MQWLVKSDPDTYGWPELVKEGATRWDGVRNPEARNHLAGMRPGERVLVYHSGADKAVVGIARVTKAAYPEPGAEDPRWLAVDLEPVKKLAQPVTLAAIKAVKSLARIPPVTRSRLSVMPLEPAAFERILSMGTGGKAAKRPRSEPQASGGGPPQAASRPKSKPKRR